MLNQTILVGRLTDTPEVIVSDNGVKRTNILVAVNRSFKNVDGTYDTDFIRCILWQGVAERTCEYCKVGDLIGVKGRLQSSRYESDGVTKYSIEVVAERVTFLSSNKNGKTENVTNEEDTL
ncbi:MAG: single-stranded DNA-binding protein [Bacilli bacterium]